MEGEQFIATRAWINRGLDISLNTRRDIAHDTATLCFVSGTSPSNQGPDAQSISECSGDLTIESCAFSTIQQTDAVVFGTVTTVTVRGCHFEDLSTYGSYCALKGKSVSGDSTIGDISFTRTSQVGILRVEQTDTDACNGECVRHIWVSGVTLKTVRFNDQASLRLKSETSYRDDAKIDNVDCSARFFSLDIKAQSEVTFRPLTSQSLRTVGNDATFK
jgi:hypothetical protein